MPYYFGTQKRDPNLEIYPYLPGQRCIGVWKDGWVDARMYGGMYVRMYVFLHACMYVNMFVMLCCVA